MSSSSLVSLLGSRAFALVEKSATARDPSRADGLNLSLSPSLGPLSVLPSNLLLRIFSYLPLENIYLELRFANKDSRVLATRFIQLAVNVLSAVSAWEPYKLADALRAIQTCARSHPLHKKEWDSPHPILHTQRATFVDEVEGGVLEVPAMPPPAADFTVPAPLARLFKASGFEINDKKKGSIDFLIEFASRFYGCAWTQKEPQVYGEPGPSKFREVAVEFIAAFDDEISAQSIKRFLEVGRTLWATEPFYRRARTLDPFAEMLSSLLSKFPKFVGNPNKLHQLLDMLKAQHEGVTQLSPGQTWQIRASLEKWSDPANLEQLPARFLELLQDPTNISAEAVTNIIISVVDTRVLATAPQVVPENDEAELAEMEREERVSDEATRNLLLSIATRQHFPDLDRLAKIIYFVADRGAAGNRRGQGADSAARAAQLFDLACTPLWSPPHARQDELDLVEVQRCITTLAQSYQFTRSSASFLATCINDWTTSRDTLQTGLLARFELNQLIPHQIAMSGGSGFMFHLIASTEHHLDLVPFFVSSNIEFTDAVYADWDEHLLQYHGKYRKANKKKINEVKKAIAVAVREGSVGMTVVKKEKEEKVVEEGTRRTSKRRRTG